MGRERLGNGNGLDNRASLGGVGFGFRGREKE